MRMPDNYQRQNCLVIPFVRPAASEDAILKSSIATVIAVTFLHHEGESPEKRLIEIIDAPGEAEILDVADVMEEREIHSNSPRPYLQTATKMI